MKLSLALLLALVLLVALDAPTSADAQRRRRVRRGTCRRSCRGFGGRFRSCSYCRPIVNCRRACTSRPRNFNRCVRRCRNVNRQVRRGRCYRRRGFVCRRNVRVQPVTPIQPVTPVTPVVSNTAVLIPGQFNAATNFCSEKCYSDARFISAAQCDRRFCFVRSSCGAFPQFPRAGRCTAGGVTNPVTLPDARVCFGNCLLESQFTGQFACDGRVCELRPCGTSLAARTFSCVAQQPVTVTPTPTMVAGMTPSPSPVVCPSACQSGVNAQVSFLTVQPTCPTTGCRIIRCTVQGATVTTLGHACVGPSVRGDAITATPPSTESNFPDGQAAVTPSTSPSPSPSGSATTTTVVSPTPSPTASVTPSPSATMTMSVTMSPTATPTPTPSPTSTSSVTPSPTPVANNLSASEWERCTITRGGTINRQNARSAPNGNPINVRATIRPQGVVNLGCRRNVTTVTCNTNGSIRVQVTNAAQAAQLTLSDMYPVGAIIVYDRAVYGTPCLLTSFTSAANEDQARIAERQMRRLAAEVADVYCEITRVSGTPADATITCTQVSPLAMFSDASISNVGTPTSRLLKTGDDDIAAMAGSDRQVAVQSEEEDFNAVLTAGTIVVNFDGDINTETNRVDEVNIVVGGNTVTSSYTIRYAYNMDYAVSYNNIGDEQIRRVEEQPALRSNFTDYPEVPITPDGVCCPLPTLKFNLLFEIFPYLTIGFGGSGTVSSSAMRWVADYAPRLLTVTANGPVNSPSVSFGTTLTTGAAGDLTNDASGVQPPTTVSINPSPLVSRDNFDVNVNLGMIPSVSCLFPSVIFSVQQKLLFSVDDRDGDGSGDFGDADDEGASAAEGGAAPGTDNGRCTNNAAGTAAAYDLRIMTKNRAVDSQIVMLGGGISQIGGTLQTSAITDLDVAENILNNMCFRDGEA